MSDIKVFDLPLDEILRLARAERYICQSVARMALPKERVSKCLRLTKFQSDVEVWKHRKTRKAFYSGLIVCGSVWTCPICAAKISERRRQELKSAYDQHIAAGGRVALLTLTFSHKKNDRLRETLASFSKASSDFRSGDWFKKIRDELGLIGSIRAFEITYGSNGWHPHSHIALFYTNEAELSLIEYRMRKQWKKKCQKYDLDVKEEYGLRLEDGEKANDYMAKHGTWGLDREMTKSHIKKGREKSITPFDLLRLYVETEKKKYIDLFAEYGQALKGKQQLHWSPDLKKRFLIDEKSDEELANEKQEEAELLGTIDYYSWKLMLRSEKRSYILDLCETEGFEKAMDYVANYIKKEKHSSEMLSPN